MPDLSDRIAARERLLARFRDEAAGPPNGTEAAMRCTAHGRFIIWTDPPLPPVTIDCPHECGADPAEQPAPILRLVQP